MNDLPAFEEVHVVSDLHLGGGAGFQGFRETARLANHIRRLAVQRPRARLALVLNGDVFDTLAEDIAGCIATDEARDTVARIVDDPAFAPVWQALADFTRQPGRRLVLVIGNHDLELALPAVQRLLTDTLAGSDPAARDRLEFSATGGGFACRVGGCRVFCTHGNEVDAWNYNRYEDLARLVRRLNAGLPMAPSEWRPNAGTRLVKEVMNRVKRRYAWIDLLKPEDSAAIGALLVLDPAQAGKLLPLARLMAGAQRRGRGDAAHRLSATEAEHLADSVAATTTATATATATATDDDDDDDDDDAPDTPGVGPNLRAGLAGTAAPTERGDDLLQVAEQHLAEPPDRSSAGAHRLLGLQGGWRLRLQRLAPSEALRLALLDWLAADRSFDVDAPDATSRLICDSVGDEVDFIIAGHTHLERALDRGDGRAYFNTGTWMRLLRLTPAMLASREAFAPVWAVLADGSLQALDAAVTGSGEPLVMDRSSAVAIRLAADTGLAAGADAAAGVVGPAGAGAAAESRVIGELLHVEGDGSGEPRSIRRFVRTPGR